MISAHVIHGLPQAGLGFPNRDYVHALILHFRHLNSLPLLGATTAPSKDTLDASALLGKQRSLGRRHLAEIPRWPVCQRSMAEIRCY